MFASLSNFLKAILNPLFIINMRRGNCRHSDNAVHRCADIMGHIGQEIRLSLICRFCRIKCCLQCHFLLALLLDQIIYISGTDYCDETTVFFLYKRNPCLQIYGSVICMFFVSQRVVFAICTNMIQRQFFDKFTAAFFRNKFLCVTAQSFRPAAIMLTKMLRNSSAVFILCAVSGHGIRFRINEKNGIVL